MPAAGGMAERGARAPRRREGTTRERRHHLSLAHWRIRVGGTATAGGAAVRHRPRAIGGARARASAVPAYCRRAPVLAATATAGRRTVAVTRPLARARTLNIECSADGGGVRGTALASGSPLVIRHGEQHATQRGAGRSGIARRGDGLGAGGGAQARVSRYRRWSGDGGPGSEVSVAWTGGEGARGRRG